MRLSAETGREVKPHSAVGMQSAEASLIGLPSSSASALLMLVFVMPPDVGSRGTPG